MFDYEQNITNANVICESWEPWCELRGNIKELGQTSRTVLIDELTIVTVIDEFGYQ